MAGEILTYPGCCRCLCKIIADKDRIILCLSDPKNALKERKEHDAEVLKYDRLMDEQEGHVRREYPYSHAEGT